jgi:hypothetical protein
MNEKALRNYRKQAPRVVDTFKVMLRVLKEHLRRHEEAMFTEDFESFNPKLSAEANKLALSIKNLGEMYLKIEAAAKKEAELLTFEEELEGFLLWLEHDLGRNHQMIANRRLMEVQHRIEAKHGKSKVSPDKIDE